MNPKLDFFFDQTKIWKEELILLRTIVLDSELIEELKWNAPCYSFQNKNICIILNFKAYYGLSFFKGAFINDPFEILVKPGENTQKARLIKLTNLQDLENHKKAIALYINQAVELEKTGFKTNKIQINRLEIIEELETAFHENPKLKVAFESLTAGRQRAYHMFFSGAIQSQTRVTRIKKFTEQILRGKGINDCTCGLSKKMPQCDGSHKVLKNKI